MLESMGIYGWAHLIQVMVILGILGVCVGYVIPRCSRDIDEMWEELKREETSQQAAEEVPKKSLSTPSIAREIGSVKEG